MANNTSYPIVNITASNELDIKNSNIDSDNSFTGDLQNNSSSSINVTDQTLVTISYDNSDIHNITDGVTFF